MDIYVDTVFDYFTIVEVRLGIPKLGLASWQEVIEGFGEYLRYLVGMVEKGIKGENKEILELYLEFLKIKKMNVMGGDNTQQPVEYVTQLAKNLYNYQDGYSKWLPGQHKCDINASDIDFFCNGNTQKGLEINCDEILGEFYGFLKELLVERSIVFVGGESIRLGKAAKTQEIFGVKYIVEEYSRRLVDSLTFRYRYNVVFREKERRFKVDNEETVSEGSESDYSQDFEQIDFADDDSFADDFEEPPEPEHSVSGENFIVQKPITNPSPSPDAHTSSSKSELIFIPSDTNFPKRAPPRLSSHKTPKPNPNSKTRKPSSNSLGKKYSTPSKNRYYPLLLASIAYTSTHQGLSPHQTPTKPYLYTPNFCSKNVSIYSSTYDGVCKKGYTIVFDLILNDVGWMNWVSNKLFCKTLEKNLSDEINQFENLLTSVSFVPFEWKIQMRVTSKFELLAKELFVVGLRKVLWLSSTAEKGKITVPVETDASFSQLQWAWIKLRVVMNLSMDLGHQNMAGSFSHIDQVQQRTQGCKVFVVLVGKFSEDTKSFVRDQVTKNYDRSYSSNNNSFVFPRPSIIPVGPKSILDIKTAGKQTTSVCLSYFQVEIENFNAFYLDGQFNQQQVPHFSSYKLAKQYLIFA